MDAEQMDGVLHGTFYLKTRLDARQVYTAIHLAILDLRTLRDLVIATERLVAALASVFGMLATILAAVELYGV